MKWDRAVVLEGLECTVQTWFPTSSSRLSELNLLDAHYDEHLPDVWAEVLRMHCRRLFGVGKQNRIWQNDEVTFEIRHDDRFVEAYWLTIKRKRFSGQITSANSDDN
jgi:hypothetical protein